MAAKKALSPEEQKRRREAAIKGWETRRKRAASSVDSPKQPSKPSKPKKSKGKKPRYAPSPVPLPKGTKRTKKQAKRDTAVAKERKKQKAAAKAELRRLKRKLAAIEKKLKKEQAKAKKARELADKKVAKKLEKAEAKFKGHPQYEQTKTLLNIFQRMGLSIDFSAGKATAKEVWDRLFREAYANLQSFSDKVLREKIQEVLKGEDVSREAILKAHRDDLLKMAAAIDARIASGIPNVIDDEIEKLMVTHETEVQYVRRKLDPYASTAAFDEKAGELAEEMGLTKQAVYSYYYGSPPK